MGQRPVKNTERNTAAKESGIEYHHRLNAIKKKHR